MSILSTPPRNGRSMPLMTTSPLFFTSSSISFMLPPKIRVGWEPHRQLNRFLYLNFLFYLLRCPCRWVVRAGRAGAAPPWAWRWRGRRGRGAPSRVRSPSLFSTTQPSPGTPGYRYTSVKIIFAIFLTERVSGSIFSECTSASRPHQLRKIKLFTMESAVFRETFTCNIKMYLKEFPSFYLNILHVFWFSIYSDVLPNWLFEWVPILTLQCTVQYIVVVTTNRPYDLLICC